MWQRGGDRLGRAYNVSRSSLQSYMGAREPTPLASASDMPGFDSSSDSQGLLLVQGDKVTAVEISSKRRTLEEASVTERPQKVTAAEDLEDE